MVKSLIILLSCFFLGISIAPCSDMASVQQAQSELVSLQDVHHHDEHKDACPPFCSCHCCQSNIIQSNSFPQQIFSQNSLDFSAWSIENLDLGFTTILFQPPRTLI